LNLKTKQVTYSAANNAPILIRNNEIIELGKDRMPVGKGERTESFTLQEIELQKDDTLYLYTDGYADQFGGPKGKKFLYKRLNEFILSINNDPFVHKGEKLNLTFENWRGDLEQVDDVLIIGIKI
jgi:serine phosphatase RsbU (regulator of sigma subunit)